MAARPVSPECEPAEGENIKHLADVTKFDTASKAKLPINTVSKRHLLSVIHVNHEIPLTIRQTSKKPLH